MKLKVENFGKIRSACVEMNGYSIFVGDNNSGKTYLMQLIYGVTEALNNIHSFECPLFDDFPFFVNSENLSVFQDAVNKWLDENKNKIVKDTFNSEISILRIKRSYIVINSNRDCSEFFSILNNFYKTCLVCDFNNQRYFYLSDIKTLV